MRASMRSPRAEGLAYICWAVMFFAGKHGGEGGIGEDEGGDHGQRGQRRGSGKGYRWIEALDDLWKW